MSHVRTSSRYPQRNGKLKHWIGPFKEEGGRAGTPLSLKDAQRVTERHIREYNEVRFHSVIGIIEPIVKLGGERKWLCGLRPEVGVGSAEESSETVSSIKKRTAQGTAGG